MSDDLKDAVARGAAWLDEHHPNWWKEIDTDTLDQGTCTNCVLGQLYSWYGNGLRVCNADSGWSHDHGFVTMGGFGVLTDLWQEEIRLRTRRAPNQEAL